VINNEDDVLLISLAVTCDQRVTSSKLRYTLFCGRLVDDRVIRWSLSVRPSVRLSARLFRTRQLEIRADPKYFLLLAICYFVIADGRRSCRSSGPASLARAINYDLYGLQARDSYSETLVKHRAGLSAIAGFLVRCGIDRLY